MTTSISRIVIIQNHLEELGGITRFCSLVGRGFESRGYAVEIGSISPPVHGEPDVYPSHWNTWTLTPQFAPHVRRGKWRGSQSRRAQDEFNASVVNAAKDRFAGYGPETVVIFTQLYARERIGNICDVGRRIGQYHLVAMYHGSYLGASLTGDNTRALEAFAEADKFLALTARDAEDFRVLGLNNVGFVRNPMPEIRPVSYPDESRKVVSLGRYSSEKSVDHLVEAWALLGDQTEQWTLELYGEGPERGLLEALIRRHNLQNVHLMGSTNNALEKLAQAAFSVQSSQHEGQPLALIESSALGIPAVAYNCTPGVEEIIQAGKTGYLALANDTSDLAHGMSELMSSVELRKELGAAARQHAENTFGVERVLDDWQEIFRQLLV